jgi:hypothetical protein
MLRILRTGRFGERHILSSLVPLRVVQCKFFDEYVRGWR